MEGFHVEENMLDAKLILPPILTMSIATIRNTHVEVDGDVNRAPPHRF